MIIKNSIRSFLTQICIFICNFVVAIITARFFGPEGKGAYFLVILASIFLVSIFKANLDPTTVYLVGSKRFKSGDVYNTLLALGSTVGILSLILFWGFYMAGGDKFFPGIGKPTILIGALAAPFNILTLYLTSIFWSKDEVKKVNLIQAIQPVLNIIGLIVLVALHPTIELAVSVYTASFFVTFLISYFMAYRQVLSRETGRFSKLIAKELYKYGLKLHLGDLIDVIINRIDSFMVSFFLGATAVGYYSVSVNGEIVWMLPTAIGFAIFPSVASLSKGNSSELVAKTCRVVFSISAICVVILILLSHPIISIIYGSKFLPAVGPFIMLLPGVLALCVSKVLKNYLIGQNHPWLPTIGSIIAVIVDLVALLVFVPRYGIIGAAMSTSLSYIIYAIVVLVSFIRVTKLSLRDVFIVRKSDYTFLQSKISGFINKSKGQHEAITN